MRGITLLIKFEIMKYKHVIIGEIIKEKVSEKGLTSSAFAKLIGKQKQNMESTVYSKASIDTNLLITISEVLDFDFFQFYHPVGQKTERSNNIYDADENELKATLTIELTKEKKDQVLKLVFGENNLEILNK